MKRYPFPFINSTLPYLARVDGVVNLEILPKPVKDGFLFSNLVFEKWCEQTDVRGTDA
jgi:hypothetical protein